MTKLIDKVEELLTEVRILQEQRSLTEQKYHWFINATRWMPNLEVTQRVSDDISIHHCGAQLDEFITRQMNNENPIKCTAGNILNSVLVRV